MKKIMQFFKRNLGWILVVGGAFLTGIAVYAIQVISEDEGLAKGFTDFFSDKSPVVAFFGGEAQEKIAQYYGPVLALLCTGVLLVISGIIIMAIQAKRKRSRR